VKQLDFLKYKPHQKLNVALLGNWKFGASCSVSEG
jgi:hypothetical protein